MISLQDVANYMRIRRYPKFLAALLTRRKPIITFTAEHENRPPRYVAIVNAYKARTPVKEIEAEFGCSRTTIHRYADMADVVRERGVPGRREAILSMYEQGKPIAEIAARLGVSQALVSKIATDAGINRRKFKKSRSK